MIENLIETLSTEEDLSKPLLKTLVFARRMGNEYLANWVLQELNGYDLSDTLPNYRYGKASLSATLKQKGQLTNPVSLPLVCFSKETVNVLVKKPFFGSVSVLEAICSDKNNKYIIDEYAADMLQSLSQEVRNNGHDFSVINCRQIVAVAEIKGIFISIKTKLLDLLLRIEKDFPDLDVVKSEKEEKSDINQVINYFINEIYSITNVGDKNVINTGNDTSVSVNVDN